MYETTIELNREIDVENSKYKIGGRGCEMILQKTEKDQSEEYWPRLLKSSSKAHWLKVDFNKWQDEDGEDGEEGGMAMPGMGGGPGGGDFEEMMRQMGGLGGMGGMPGMGGMGGMPGMEGMGGLDDLETPEDESDDEALPDLEETTGKDQPPNSSSPTATTTA